MTRARDVSRLITTPPNIYATDSEASSGFLSLSSASSTYLTQSSASIIYQGSPHRNLIINGDMQIAQRATSVSSITSGGYYTADRWNVTPVSLGTWTQSVENDAPSGSGFRKSLKLLCTTADASPAASDVLRYDYRFEGQNLQQVKKGTAAAEQLTLSFWVKANVTGTYIVGLYDYDNTRYVAKSYTINSSATWEYKTITFPADTTGSLDNDNAASLEIEFGLATGTDRSSGTLATTWQSYTAANALVGQVNLASAINNYWQITGAQLEVGSVATPFEFKSVENELLECQRYYQSIAQFNTFWCTSVRQAAGPVNFIVPFRTSPNTYGSTTGFFRYGPGGQRNIVTSSFSDFNQYACYAIINDDGAATPFTTNFSTVVRLVQGFSAEL
jgi:hypothetical protein